jgi:hypothetical protein
MISTAKDELCTMQKEAIEMYHCIENILNHSTELDINHKNNYIVEDILDDVCELEITISEIVNNIFLAGSKDKKFDIFPSIRDRLLNLVSRVELTVSKAELIK